MGMTEHIKGQGISLPYIKGDSVSAILPGLKTAWTWEGYYKILPGYYPSRQKGIVERVATGYSGTHTRYSVKFNVDKKIRFHDFAPEELTTVHEYEFVTTCLKKIQKVYLEKTGGCWKEQRDHETYWKDSTKWFNDELRSENTSIYSSCEKCNGTGKVGWFGKCPVCSGTRTLRIW